MGALIAKWSLHLTFEHWYATPWAQRSILGDYYSFLAQSLHQQSTFREDRENEAEKPIINTIICKEVVEICVVYESLLKMENKIIYKKALYLVKYCASVVH